MSLFFFFAALVEKVACLHDHAFDGGFILKSIMKEVYLKCTSSLCTFMWCLVTGSFPSLLHFQGHVKSVLSFNKHKSNNENDLN